MNDPRKQDIGVTGPVNVYMYSLVFALIVQKCGKLPGALTFFGACLK